MSAAPTHAGGGRGYYPTYLRQMADRLRAQALQCEREDTDASRLAATALRDAAAELDETARAITDLESDQPGR